VLAQGGSPTGIAAAREGVAALKSFAWLVVLLAALGLIAGYLLGGPANGAKYRVWVTAQALGTNGSVTDLGISTPDGPQAADFLGDGIIKRLEASTGHDYDYLTEKLELDQPPNGGPNPPIALIANAGSDAEAKALLGAWLTAVHEARLRYVSGVVARGERKLRKSFALAAKRGEPATEKAIVDLLARAQALRGTLSVDYSILRSPRLVAATAVSRPRSAAIGAGVGLIAGLALALLLSLLGGRLRTAEGIEAALGIEVLADLSSVGRIPSAEHARERLRALGDGRPPGALLLVPCGSVAPEAIAKLSDALGEGVEARVAGEVGEAGLLAKLEQADAWAVVASPGAARRAEAVALSAELGGIGKAPAGLLLA